MDVGGVPVHPTNLALRQRAILRIQKRRGNSYVQRMLHAGHEKIREETAGEGGSSISRQEPPRPWRISQAAAPAQIMREDEETDLERLRTLLDDDDEDDAIDLMGWLSTDDIRTVLNSAEYKRLAVSAFNNEEMYRAIRAMNGNLYRGLQWMFEEGTDWEKVRDVITHATSGKEQAREHLRGDFVSLCDNEEMAEAVDLLGGDLEFKLTWMKEEGTSWSLVEPKIRATADDGQKQAIRDDDEWRSFFVGLCGNDEMGLAVQLLGGTLEWKLEWMKEEGVDWQRLVQVIAGTTSDDEKRTIRESDTWRDFFVSYCNDEEMARVVDGLGGDLEFRLTWMRAEGSSWELVARQLRYCTDDTQKEPIRDSDEWMAFFVSLCNNQEMSEAVELLGGDLTVKLKWMAAEGADWPQLREKLALESNEDQKRNVREDDDMKAFFVDTCGNEQMAEAVDLLGGDLEFKLTWMKEEGTSWELVHPKLSACSDDTQKEAIRTDDEWRTFFVGLCSGSEMARVVELLGGDLAFKLDWLKEGGSNWNAVKTEIIGCTDDTQKQAIREDEGMKGYFVDLCNDEEMAEAVDLLGGDLAFKLDWMREEGTNWQLVREKLAATTDEDQLEAIRESEDWMSFITGLCSEDELAEANRILSGEEEATLTLETVQAGMSWRDLKTQLLLLRDDELKSQIRISDEWRDAFVSICGNDEMAEAVDIIGGDLAWKLTWMKEEGTDWQAVKEKIRACQDDTQKEAVRNESWKEFFTSECNNEEMAEAVRLLGGDLSWKLGWMIEEGTSADLVLPIIRAAPQTERDTVAGNSTLCEDLADAVGGDATSVFEALNSPGHTAAALIESGGDDNLIQALRIVATSTDVAATVAQLRTLNAWNNFLNDCPKGPDLPTVSKTQVNTVYNNGSCTVDEKKKLIHIRYNVEISEAGIEGLAAVAWNAASLDAVYQVLGQLPEGTVSTNEDLSRLHLVVSGIGTYYPGYNAIHLPGGAGYSMASTWPAAITENHFRGTVRHEVGHAIDQQVNGSDWYMNDPHVDWDEFSSVGGWLASMETYGGWGPVTDEAEREQIRSRIRSHFSDPGIATATFFPADAAHPANTYAATCPILQTIQLNQTAGSHNNYAAMPNIGGKVFMRRSDYRKFYSYKDEARNPPQFISAYGLSAPPEWFAEQLREYFRTSPNGQNNAEFVKNWFRMNLP